MLGLYGRREGASGWHAQLGLYAVAGVGDGREGGNLDLLESTKSIGVGAGTLVGEEEDDLGSVEGGEGR